MASGRCFAQYFFGSYIVGIEFIWRVALKNLIRDLAWVILAVCAVSFSVAGSSSLAYEQGWDWMLEIISDVRDCRPVGWTSVQKGSHKTVAECFFDLSVNVRSFLDDSQARDPSRVEIALGSTLGGVKNFQAAQGLQIYSFTEIF